MKKIMMKIKDQRVKVAWMLTSQNTIKYDFLVSKKYLFDTAYIVARNYNSTLTLKFLILILIIQVHYLLAFCIVGDIQTQKYTQTQLIILNVICWLIFKIIHTCTFQSALFRITLPTLHQRSKFALHESIIQSMNSALHLWVLNIFCVISYFLTTSTFRNRSCDKLAVIYVKLTYAKRRTSSNNFGTAPLTGLASAQSERLCYQNNERRKADIGSGRRKRSTSISQSLALEKGMLSRLHCVGVVPVPWLKTR